MSLLSLFRPKTPLPLAQQLARIGYFELITDPVKREKIMEVIDQNAKPGVFGNGNHWLYIPNEDYLKMVFGLAKENERSRTADFRSFELSPRDMVGDQLEWYLHTVKMIMEKNGLQFDWSDEKVDWARPEPAIETIDHTIRFNGYSYSIYSGNVRSKGSRPAMDYITNFRRILNEVVRAQGSRLKFVLLTAPETICFVLTSPELLKELKKIVAGTDNEVEE
jgi:CxxC motif-containing protein